MNERTEFEEYLVEKCKGFEDELKSVREEVFELHTNLIFYRQFYTWAKNRLEEEGIQLTENGVKKPSEMTKAELIARNQLTVRKQESKVSDCPSDLPPMPEYEELLKQYEEQKPNGVIRPVTNYFGLDGQNTEVFVHQALILNLKQDYLRQKIGIISKKENITVKDIKEIMGELEAVYGGNPLVMKAGQELLDKAKELYIEKI